MTIPGNICVASTASRILFEPGTRSRARAYAAALPSASDSEAVMVATMAESMSASTRLPRATNTSW